MLKLSYRFFSLFLFFVLTAYTPEPLEAQQGTAALVGDVADPQGAPVKGANVTLSDPANGFTRKTQTDEQGHFQFLSLPPASYQVRVEARSRA